MNQGLCPYCGNVRRLTAEHVLPRAIGGNLLGAPTVSGLAPGNPFKLGVCAKCNAACGTWIDGMFTRSWPLHSARYSAALHHIDLEHGAVPLCYLGKTDLRADELEADLWMGPAGDAVYHLHEPYPREHVTVGVPHWIDRDRLDRGIVLAYGRASNPQWHPVVVRSIANEFEDTPIFWLNAVVTDPDTGERRTGSVPDKYLPLARLVHGSINREGHHGHELEIVRDINCGHRFLVKLALGFGALFLDRSFWTSSDADELRSCLWNRDIESWPDGLIGTPFFLNVDDVLDRLTNWRGCHFLMLHRHEHGVALTVKLYGHYYGSFRVATSRYGFEQLGSPQVIWIVAPGLRQFAGPMSLDEYTVAYLQPSTRDRLAHLRATLDAAPTLPPFDLMLKEQTALLHIGVR